jgi:hypothetical protein
MGWHAVLRRFEATADMPPCLYSKELLQAFPEAKAILTVPESARWYASFLALLRFINRVRRFGRVIPRLGKMVRFSGALLDRTLAGSLEHNNSIRDFNEQTAAVQRSLLASAPAGRRAAPAPANHPCRRTRPPAVKWRPRPAQPLDTSPRPATPFSTPEKMNFAPSRHRGAELVADSRAQVQCGKALRRAFYFQCPRQRFSPGCLGTGAAFRAVRQAARTPPGPCIDANSWIGVLASTDI